MRPSTLTYSVRIERDGRFWALLFPDLGDDHASQALKGDSIDRIVAIATDYIALTLDVDPESVRIGFIRVDLDAADNERAASGPIDNDGYSWADAFTVSESGR